MRKKEIIFGIIVGLLLLVVLGVCEEVKVSNGTTIINKKISENSYNWTDGMGTTVKIRYIEPEDIKKYEKAEEYTVFDITVEQKDGPTFLMVDLDYDKMKLTDNEGKEYPLLNEEIAADTPEELKPLLETFKWTMFNQAFPGGESLAVDELVWNGILVFSKVDKSSKSLDLQLTYNMSGQKARHIECDFEVNK